MTLERFLRLVICAAAGVIIGVLFAYFATH
jgi:hypothetical protein